MPPGTPSQPAGNATPTPPSPLKQIRTYQGDVADALARQNESLYSIQAKEHARGGSSAAPAVKSAWPLIVGSFLLLAFASIGGYLAYGEYARKTTPPPPAVPPSRLLSAESAQEIDIAGLGRDELIAAIAGAGEGAKAGELRHIILESGTSTVSAAAFFGALDARVPPNLERALDPAFMLGALGENRFLIFKLASFPNAFGGMLTWEETLASDLGPVLAAPASVKTIGSASVFKDVVYKNKDVRVLYAEGLGADGATTTAPALLYSFFESRALIITSRLETLQTLIDRLTQETLAR